MDAGDLEALEVRLLLEAIQARYGYDLRGYNQGTIRRRVMSALTKSGLANLGELQHRVVHDPVFFAQVLEDLLVQVTEMFRDPSFYRALRSRVVPILRTYPLLRFWHSGCATAEEVYSNAILLTEEGLYDRTQIYATDVSAAALREAEQGVYSDPQVATFAQSYARAGGVENFSRYYTAAYGQAAMKETLRRNILFFQHNLVSDHSIGEMHVIFSRNVLIYFGKELRDQVLRKFAASLCFGGFLCLGSSERLLRPEEYGFVDFDPDERIYRYQT